MLQTVLLVLLILDSVVLAIAVLLQSGKGTGMAASFGGVSSSPDAFIGTRQAGNLLTKMTWWSGGVFLGIAFVLQITSTRARTPKSVLDQSLTPPPAAPSAPSAPSTAAPALPFQPAPSAPPSAPPSGAPQAPAGAAAPRPPATGRPAPAAPSGKPAPK
jgi:preprotein translocase subunit SecG